jgi:hypothetical protein
LSIWGAQSTRFTARPSCTSERLLERSAKAVGVSAGVLVAIGGCGEKERLGGLKSRQARSGGGQEAREGEAGMALAVFRCRGGRPFPEKNTGLGPHLEREAINRPPHPPSCLRNPSGPRCVRPAFQLRIHTDPTQRQTLARVARQQPALLARRTFITPTAVRQGTPSPAACQKTLLMSLALLSRSCPGPVPSRAQELQGSASQSLRRRRPRPEVRPPQGPAISRRE